MIIYFIGGEDVKKRTMKEIYIRALSEAKNKKVLVLLWTTENEEKRKKYAKILSDYFYDVGAEKVIAVEPNIDKEQLEKLIGEVGVIYLPGGLPEVLIKYARKYNLESLLKNFNGVIIGNSAGALALCKDVIITKDEDHPETKIIKGIGLVDFSIEVHYDESRDDELKNLAKDRTIYAVSEDSAIRYDGNFEFFGKVRVFRIYNIF